MVGEEIWWLTSDSRLEGQPIRARSRWDTTRSINTMLLTQTNEEVMCIIGFSNSERPGMQAIHVHTCKQISSADSNRVLVHLSVNDMVHFAGQPGIVQGHDDNM